MGMVFAPENNRNFIVELTSVRDREQRRYLLPRAHRGISVVPVTSFKNVQGDPPECTRSINKFIICI